MNQLPPAPGMPLMDDTYARRRAVAANGQAAYLNALPKITPDTTSSIARDQYGSPLPSQMSMTMPFGHQTAPGFSFDYNPSAAPGEFTRSPNYSPDQMGRMAQAGANISNALRAKQSAVASGTADALAGTVPGMGPNFFHDRSLDLTADSRANAESGANVRGMNATSDRLEQTTPGMVTGLNNANTRFADMTPATIKAMDISNKSGELANDASGFGNRMALVFGPSEMQNRVGAGKIANTNAELTGPAQANAINAQAEGFKSGNAAMAGALDQRAMGLREIAAWQQNLAKMGGGMPQLNQELTPAEEITAKRNAWNENQQSGWLRYLAPELLGGAPSFEKTLQKHRDNAVLAKANAQMSRASGKKLTLEIRDQYLQQYGREKAIAKLREDGYSG